MTDETPQRHEPTDPPAPASTDATPAGDADATDRLPGGDAPTRQQFGEPAAAPPAAEFGSHQTGWSAPTPRSFGPPDPTLGGAATPRPGFGEPGARVPEFGSPQTDWVASPPPDPFRPPVSAMAPPPAPPEPPPDTPSYGGFGQYGQYASYGSPIPGYSSPVPAGGTPPGGTGRKRRRGFAALAAVLAAALVGGGVGAAVEHQFDDVTPAAANALDTPPLPQTSSKAPTGSVEQVAQAVRRSVVSIIVSAANGGDEGTGVILSSDGLILTNNHVVAAAADGGRVTVTFDNGKSASAQIVGRDPTSDLAVIRAQGVNGLHPATLGRSADLAVGQQVVAIGSPLGLSGTVTSGIVSALNRPVRTGGDDPGSTATVMEAIQTDAAINPGNSGGPLANLSGQVVGINSAIATVGQSAVGGQSGNIGVGFAIPIDQARPIANELIKQGHAEHSQLGVTVSDSRAAGVSAGALVRSVNPGGSADHAGLKPNDLITRVDDQKIDGADALVAVIRAHRPGDKVTVVYTRGGSSHTTAVTLGRQ